MKGVGGLAALSMSNATVAQAQDVLEEPLEEDPHTVDTYRAIVDAVLPRTPQLEDELGPEHVPGGLDVELEKFIIWDFNHFQEIRSESIAPAGTVPADGEMPQSLFEVALDTTGEGTDLDALRALGDDPDDATTGDLDADALEAHLSFGSVGRFEVTFSDLDSTGEGPAAFDLLVQDGSEVHHAVLQNYPYANTFPYAFDLVAAEFLARGENEDAPSPNPEFAGGGTFVRLSRRDRLRCLWTIVDGGAVDRLDGLLSPMMPVVGLLKFVVMAVNGLHGFGYYTEWSGYGETKTDDPADRELQVPEDEVQSRTQTGYPGPTNGYAADWRHVIDGGFTDVWEPDDGPPDDTPGQGPPDDTPGQGPPDDTPREDPPDDALGTPGGEVR